MKLWNMKALCRSYSLLFLLFFLSLHSCAAEDNEEKPLPQEDYYSYVSADYDPDMCYFRNNPLPVGLDTLRILAIGNSFTYDGIAYLKDIILSCDISMSQICLYYLTEGGASLQYWSDILDVDTEVVATMSMGDINFHLKETTVRNALRQPWDVVVLQQNSANAPRYDTYNPYLRHLIDAIRENCPNPHVVIAWQMVWAYSSKHSATLAGEEGWKHICMATKYQMMEDGIDIIIPTGTAIQNARHTSLCDEGELTRDDVHLSRGTGRYIAACTWFETLFKPVFGCSMLGCDATYELTDTDYEESNYPPTPVDDTNNGLCQLCAFAAVNDKFLLTTIDETRAIDPVMSLYNIGTLGLPVVSIETVDAEEPTCDYVIHPEGATGKSIANATKVPGRLVIEQGGHTLFDTGNYSESSSGMTIKIRGNTSAYTDKKPYKVKLQSKADLLLRDNDSLYRDKEWLLLKEGTTLHTYIGLTLGRMIGCEWEPAMRYVNLVINGDYRGVYILAEAIKASPARIGLDKKTGFVVERDSYWWNEEVYFKSVWGHYWTFKDPEADELKDGQYAYITACIDQLERGIWDAEYEKFMDINSFATWLLAHDILGTEDNGGSNIYIKRYDNNPDTKLQMPMLWDFDSVMRSKDTWARIHNVGGLYFKTLFNSHDHSFARAYKEKWDEVKPYIFSDIISNLRTLATSDEAKAIDASRLLDNKRWNSVCQTVGEEADKACQWFAERRKWLESAIDGIAIGIGTPCNYTKPQPEADIYDLLGRRMARGRSGITITPGHKTIID